MSNKSLRIIFMLAVLCTVLVIITQFFWLRKAYDLEKSLFNTHVTVALKNVAIQLRNLNNNKSPVDSIVTQASDNYYTVKVDDKIDSTVLEHLLKRELLAQQIKTDFEYSVYDCETENMRYGKYVSFKKNIESDEIPEQTVFPRSIKGNNYFAVNFPLLQDFLNREMINWFISSGVLVLFLLILAYAIFIIFRQKRLSEIQKDFVNNMTHEFKTPLATIKISSEVLKSPNIINNPERLLNYATIINNETLHLTHQVERVLQMAKSDRDKLELNIETVALKPMLLDMIDKTYKPLLRTRGGDIRIFFKPDDVTINIDRLHMKNVISNLLDNAIKYCAQNPEIDIRCEDTGTGVSISIQDNGIGMSKENIKHIFNKFYRIPTGNLHDVKGFGLGLNYVKLICKLHGGSVSVKSELDKGSEFCIFIPKSLNKK
jgi:two-component system phosphate regulon sensor histidine kinase PhoR